MAVYSGNVENIIFHNAEDDFYILRVRLDKTLVGYPNPMIARGRILGIVPKKGTWFSFDAVLDRHPKHGNQMKIRKAPVMKKHMGKESISGILISQGVSPLIARQLVLKFGDLSYSKLNSPNAVEHLSKLDGVTPVIAEFVSQKWKSYMAFFEAMDFFEEVGIPKKKYNLVWKTFGKEAKEVLSSNPWRLTRIEGIAFAQADEVARKLHCSMDSPERLEGACLSAITSWRGMGHLYLSVEDVKDSVSRSLSKSVSISEVKASLKKLDEQKDIVFEHFLSVSGKTYESAYTKWNYTLETKGAELLHNRNIWATLGDKSERALYKYSLIKCVHPDIEANNLEASSIEDCIKVALDFECEANNLQLSDAQYQAALNALLHPVSIITGLPGTGKTTTLKIVVAVLQRAGITFRLVAPTGIASKRLKQVTGVEASTIHRAFGSKLSKEEKEEEEANKREQTYYGIVGEGSAKITGGEGERWTHQLPDQVLICDEASMVDQHLLFRMLEGTNPRCRVVFVGDSAQLPSVGAGNVLREMIESSLFPVVSLTEIYRQSDTSDIVYAAHDIYKGKVPELKASKDLDFVFLPIQSETQILHTIKGLSDRLFKAREKFQVMSPRHSGELGVTNLNLHLRELLNPEGSDTKNHIRVGEQILREEDRVMIIKNDYGKGVFNGDTGKVYRIQPDKKVIVKVHGANPFYVDFTPKEVYHYLRLAYATTVHKMQGQETDIIVFPIVTGFRSQLQRNLFYTAITRAKKRVILLGHAAAVERAIFNPHEDQRNTLFRERLVGLKVKQTSLDQIGNP